MRAVTLVLLLNVLSWCVPASSRAIEPSSRGDVSLDSELRVGLHFLDPGLAGKNPEFLERQGIYPEIRQAESRHIPVSLKKTLEKSEAWRQVSIVPETAPVDLTVSGKILVSDGARLSIHIRVTDALGAEWLERRYKAKADSEVYSLETWGQPDEDGMWSRQEPFQKLYDRIAADLLAAKQKRSPRELRQVRWATRLKLAENLLPTAFQGFLEPAAKNQIRVARLPAEDDPMVHWVERVETAHAEFLEVLTLHQIHFSEQMMEPYDFWLRMNFETSKALEKKRVETLLLPTSNWDPSVESAADRSPTTGRWNRNRSIPTRDEMPDETAALLRTREEVSAQLEAEVEPLLMEVEGQTLRLQGSMYSQYETWNRLLHEIFKEMVGAGGVEP